MVLPWGESRLCSLLGLNGLSKSKVKWCLQFTLHTSINRITSTNHNTSLFFVSITNDCSTYYSCSLVHTDCQGICTDNHPTCWHKASHLYKLPCRPCIRWYLVKKDCIIKYSLQSTDAAVTAGALFSTSLYAHVIHIYFPQQIYKGWLRERSKNICNTCTELKPSFK